MHKLFRKGQKEAALKIRKHLQKRPSLDPHDPDYRRLKYIRDAADFALAFTGPKAEAEEIKRLIATFLREELGLHLSEEKPLLTHARTSAARFLGYEITTLHSNAKHSKTKAGFKRRSINGRIGLRIPRALLTEKRTRYQRGNTAIHRAELLNESDDTILATYQLEYRGRHSELLSLCLEQGGAKLPQMDDGAVVNKDGGEQTQNHRGRDLPHTNHARKKPSDHFFAAGEGLPRADALHHI